MTNPDQTRSSLIRVYTVCHSTKYFVKQLNKKQNLGKKVLNKAFKISGHLLYSFYLEHCLAIDPFLLDSAESVIHKGHYWMK